MSELLRLMNILATTDAWMSPHSSRPMDFTTADGSVFLKDEYEKSQHVKLSHFPDRTGYEAFVNHVHFPFDGKRDSLLGCLSYANAIRREIAPIAGSRRFQIVVSVGDDCTVRFHEIRPGEHFVAEDLESYAEEAILLLHAGSG